MRENSRIHFIPPIPKREEKVGIYCRVSTNSAEQLQSLQAQVSHLTKLTAAMPQWLLADVYMDIATSKTGSSRKEFNRMLEDCKAHKLNIILIKSISRFGRDTVEILDALNQLKQFGVRVIFEQEELDTAKTDSDLMITIIWHRRRMSPEVTISKWESNIVQQPERLSFMTGSAMDISMMRMVN